MDAQKLNSIIKKQEGPKLDFKMRLDIKTESGKKELAKDIIAIANSQGGRGHLVIGIEDKTKRVVGINHDEYCEERIQQMQKQKQALADSLFSDTGAVGLPMEKEALLALLA